MSAEPIAVHVLTGFLGSGKTTLLNSLLADEALADTAVVINEFGEIALDHLLVEGGVDDVVLLQGGWLCCVAAGSLREPRVDLYVRRRSGELPPFRRVIVETSGLADPGPVIEAVTRDVLLKERFEARTVICVADATGEATLDGFPEARAQAALADCFVITKGDRAGSNPGALALALATFNPVAPIVTAAALARKLAISEADIRLAGSTAFADPHDHRHASGIGSVSLVLAGDATWPGIAEWTAALKARWGVGLLRVKALLALAGEQRPVLVQGVRGVFDLRTLPAWPDDARYGRIVAIGADLDRAVLEEGVALLGPVRSVVCENVPA